MSRVEQFVLLDCEPEKVIEYIADVGNHPAFIGALKSVSNLSGDPQRPGTTWDWTFVMAGVEFSGKAETVSYSPGRKFSYRTTTGIRSTFVYSVEPADGGSRLKVAVDYEVPESLLGRVGASVVEKVNDAEGVRAMENIKVILDA